MQWQVRAQRDGSAAVVVLGADDDGRDVMDVIQGRLPAGEWDVVAEAIASSAERRALREGQVQ